MVTPIQIVYDHDDFVVVNKPCDIPMHDPIHGICQLLCGQLSLAHLYLVHRLDSATSGCLLLAKNKQAAAILSQLFATKQIQKFYIAVSDVKPKKKQGKIAGDMKKSRGGNYMLSQAESSQPKAITFFISESYHNIGRLFYIKPVTGKTHQIRVALKSIGSAILGDKRYKGSSSDRLYLHSMVLEFSYNKNDYCIQCMPQTGEFFSSDLLKNISAIRELSWPKFK
ncbi:MAG: tRNA pseudouridine32 synthase/23S rRNA pseudouridine746 synthase, partial [Glaciecola sp.]